MTCAYMLQSSVAYTGVGALVGVAVLLIGALFLLLTQYGHKEGEREGK
jgi:hypothetical protein